MNEEQKLTQETWDYLVNVENGRLTWSGHWRCIVMEWGQKEVGLIQMLKCRCLETWVRWNIEAWNHYHS